MFSAVYLRAAIITLTLMQLAAAIRVWLQFKVRRKFEEILCDINFLWPYSECTVCHTVLMLSAALGLVRIYIRQSIRACGISAMYYITHAG